MGLCGKELQRRRTIMQRFGIRKLSVKLATIVAIALMLAGIIAPAAKAADNQTELYIQSKLDEWAASCRAQGGQPMVHYDLFVDGWTFEARIDCFGPQGMGASKGWWCSVDFARQSHCDVIYTQPAQTPADVVAPTGSVTEAFDEAAPPTPVVIQRADGRPSAPTRPEMTPTPEPTEREGH
jgi:hypothetical protein